MIQMKTSELAPPVSNAVVPPAAVSPSPSSAPYDVPEGTRPYRIRWTYTSGIAVIHVLSLLAFVPWLFSWTGVLSVLIGHHLFGMMGMTLGYHRLLTHQGFTCPKWFEHLLAILGVCCLQDSPARWVAIHRNHQQHSDEQSDPHTPLVTLAWSHMGWLMLKNREHDRMSFYERYARDLLRDPFYMWLERGLKWIYIYMAHVALIVLAGFALGWAWSGNYWGGVQLGASWLVWGVFVRTLFVWHGTWAVNSLTHVWGYKNYQCDDNSRNNWLVALLAHGEGWHNNHHADQRAAAHGHRWWEFDITWLTVRLLERVGLIRNVVRPREWSRRA